MLMHCTSMKRESKMDGLPHDADILEEKTKRRHEALKGPLFSRQRVCNPSLLNCQKVSFSVATYNILAECHAGGEYGSAPWIQPEELLIEYRHRNLLLELEYLDADAVCLQEVGQEYYRTTLAPAMMRLGYGGKFLRRLGEEHDEGEATFYKTSCFELLSCSDIPFTQIAEKELEAMDSLSSDVKTALRSAVASHAVMQLTRLSLRLTGEVITLANIHVAWDELKRPDLQCLQIAVAMRELVAAAGGTNRPSIICGDFNCFPGMAPYHLMEDNRLTQDLLESLTEVTCTNGQKSVLATAWPQSFSYPQISMKSSYKTILGQEPITCWGLPWVCPLDYIWYCSDGLAVKDVLSVVDEAETQNGIPNSIFPSDHLSLKATFVIS